MRRLLLVLTLATATIAGCGASPQTVPLRVVPTSLAAEAPPANATQAAASEATTDKPTATKKPTKKPTATKKPPKKARYYRPKGWDGYSDVDCADFKTHKQAQSFFKGTGGSRSKDPYGLDSEHDGIACETLP